MPYEPQLHAKAEERQRLEVVLREALEKDQLHLLYQPVVDATSGVITGVRGAGALDPSRTGADPAVEIRAGGRGGSVDRADRRMVLRTACREAMRWPAHIRVAVNVSAEQLHQSNFISAGSMRWAPERARCAAAGAGGHRKCVHA